MSTIIEADPSKDFFISMLTRDISLISSIVDLIDNSVDAAISLGDIENKFVKLNLTRNNFELEDNCGGISIEAATTYAFKFGRPSNAPSTALSIGRFGVGMKRALFKMGKAFSIISMHRDGSFNVSVDVDRWLEQPKNWSFEMDTIATLEPYGTRIDVNVLHQSVAESFGEDTFLRRLEDAIEKAHFIILGKGFNIFLNNVKIGLKNILVRASDELSIASKNFQLGEVIVSVKAGIGERDLHAGGWNVICNGRLIEVSNKTQLTGWGDGVQAYHPDYAFFRGIVEFTSTNGDLLPWNTTKTGIDSDNSIYKSTLIEMKNVMRPVLALLRDLVKEKENHESGLIDETPIQDTINNSSLKSIFDLNDYRPFVRPDFIEVKRQIVHGRISYQKPIQDLERVREALGARSNKEVGELTFDYYVDNEL
ncbi:ATP-binding protein [Cellvibrio sp. OA-2007]|uniref:ATP-binding protein n=1 Tax=Cellvibrio sp. OA-2007 TaxID=529823 RepID=UPI0007815B8F|nr:ATP-binding protein [Cellvibrio sp. OA-2007]